MHKKGKYLKYLVITALGGIGICSAFAVSAGLYSRSLSISTSLDNDSSVIKNDSSKIKFPVKKTQIQSIDELQSESAIDLKDPTNVKGKIEYDEKSDTYIYKTKIGDNVISTPFSMTREEYEDYTERNLRKSYFNKKNAELIQSGSKNEFSFLDLNFGVGGAEKIFGPGGVQIKTQGSAEISFGIKQNKIDNPSLPAKSRNKLYFDFDEKVQVNVDAKVGDKLNFGMNYNTDATFDFDSKKLKLAYQGKEDEIIKNLEAGNVSMTTGSSLIRGGASLFGMKTALQFGKLNITALLAQQESTTQTVNSKGGAQTREFEFTADEYDEDRHFFLAHYFRDNYDKFISKLPYISSGVEISRIEVWVTNKKGNYEQARNIVAFMDLGESKNISNNYWVASSSVLNPSNDGNTLYKTIVNEYPDARNINLVTQALSPLSSFNIEGGSDYEKIESARKLDVNEYILNSKLGYISLKSKLNSDEVLAVAFEYTLNGKVYQVGEFSTNQENSNNTLYLKLLKGTTVNPHLPMWDLMMKNVYALNAFQIEKDKFRLNIQYMSDTTGVYLNYINAGRISGEMLLRVMNMDRLDANNETNPDTYFDYVDGYTVLPSMGRVIFPCTEPFGSYLASKIGDKVIADKYCYYELYDSTLTVARQKAEKNKFRVKGEYKSSSGAEINLNSMNVPRGSVKVTANGLLLTENSDYTVDYTMGIVMIINSSILESGANISATCENQSNFSTQRKTMYGLDMQYAYSKNFQFGATMVHLSEKPLTQKVNMDEIPINNTIYGFNASYKGESMWITNMVGKIPWVNATAPSTYNITAEYAQLVPGHSSTIKENGEVYLDDFESSQLGYDIRTPYSWQMSSTPYDPSADALFPEAAYSNDIRYGMNRALLNWYYIDRLFTQKSSSLTPSHIKKDSEQLSNHYVREVNYSEIYPNKELGYGESGILTILNMSYYPNERGAYNLDVDGMDENGNLLNPEMRWGGMMRKLETTDFETANIEYIQFWLMDPFIYDSTEVKGGDLYFNLGEISEDILKDGMKSFENGLPVDNDTTYISKTVWGRVSKKASTVYAFDNTAGARKKQDVGFDGLINDEEFFYPTYANYVERVLTKLSPSAIEKLKVDKFSPLNDPAGDNYHYYRGTDYDNDEVGILERYKHYNSVEGNSTASEDSPEKYDVSSKTVPDVEDINQDNTLNEYERYFQYRISIRPKDMQVGSNFITDKKSAKVRLRNGKEETINWYQFKVPLSDYEKQVGSIRDFKTIRFIRMFLTSFNKAVHLRFASLELMRGDWRTYSGDLTNKNSAPISKGSIDVSVVNIEENAGQLPVNYVMPPGVTRVVDPGQSQITQLNEQALSLKINDLSPSDSRAVYKKTNFDMRRFKRLQMFVHAEAPIDNIDNLKDDELCVFMRIGSDYSENYYEYEIPLSLTQAASYNNSSLSDRKAVWPESNMFNFPLSLLTDLKLKRNAEKRKNYSTVNYTTRYSVYDPDNQKNRVTIIGNPSLAEIKTIMIGVRNKSKNIKSGTIWVNELRLTDFNEKGGWAGRVNANLNVSDIASVNFGGQVETAGFGSVEQSINERRLDDYYQYNIAASVEIGKLLPQKAKISAPLFYSYANETVSPEYDPYNQDLLLSESLDNVSSKAERDSIKNLAQEVATVTSFSLANVKVNIQSQNPKPWDPSNFNLGYAFTKTDTHNPTTEYENQIDQRGNFGYSYSPFIKPWAPFSFIESKSAHLKFFKEFSINPLPNSISLYSGMRRNYFEQQLRSIELSAEGSENNIPVSFSRNFNWDRQTSISWSLFKSLRFNFSAATNARVDEPNVPVNKRLFPDEYEQWKDSVRSSLLKLGTPLKYNQSFDASYTIPLNKMPLLDWSSATLNYNAVYGWDKGVYIDEETSIGNSITNQRQVQADVKINLETLYNKSAFLKNANQKFASNKRASTSMANAKNKIARKYNQRIILKKDTVVTVKHNLNNKRVIVSAKDSKNKTYPVKYKVKDKNTIVITNKDSLPIQLSIVQGKGFEENKLYVPAQYGARGLMMIRNITFNYRNTSSTFLPSFNPMIGDFLGQNGSDGFVPGLGFAFGLDGGEDFVNKAMNKGWLIVNDSLTSPAIYSSTEDAQYKVSIEPLKGLKIELSGSRVSTQSSQNQFMFSDIPVQKGGAFTMTTIGIKTSFKNSDSKNGYSSQIFDNFLKYRNVIADRINNSYANTRYPSSGFLNGSYLANTQFNPELSSAGLSSADVMIPAFIAAYTGKDAGKVNLNAFPSIKNMLPNWRITYDGLIQIPFINKYVKSIVLNHAYRCTYSVGSFSSFLNWVAINDNMGFAMDALSNNPVCSSPFDITSVSITESFAPLLGMDVNWKNGITGRVEFKNTRNMSLNMSSVQIIESTSKDYTLGAGYKIANFNTIIGMKGGGEKSVNHDLTLRADFTHRTQTALIRKIEDEYTQPTSGNKNMNIKFTADYTFSKYITLRAYYDKQINTPLISSSAYPISNSNFGVSIRLLLTR
ncbi:MAG: cell surface protein SprA [Bacteroidales bacterium]|nr:cell surface protein SprA [Bacteroidales bacterium]